MELDEFKTSWNKYLEEERNTKPTSDHINTITMKISTTLETINEKTIYWWKFARNIMILLFIMLAANISFFILFPEKFQNLENALPVFGVLAVYALGILWVYYEKVKIFDIVDSKNIRCALEKAIRRFNRWYVLSTLLYVFLVPIMFYVVINIGAEAFLHRAFSLKTEIIACAVMTVITLVGNHFYYKKTYFKWLALLETSLKELEV
ncbi:MAG TPA: hypothetical protein PLJ60_00150 [Chryseolinea sp.]|nr:hypothetical protein [Chryseolinea sp.]HPH45363.1 hypothetical protein [Chryseolinea sp.]HPM28716.1 hypothetical protein [Chryseolinea sp.]